MSWPCTMSPLVGDHFAHRLDQRDEQRLREHIVTCEDCALRYRRWSLYERLGEAGQERPVELLASLGLATREEVDPFPWLRTSVALAALVAMVGGGLVARYATKGVDPQFQVRAEPSATASTNVSSR